MDPQAAVSRKWKAPPVDPNNSEVVQLACIAERKKQRLTPKNGLSSTPVMATVNKSRAAAALVKDIESIQSNHHANPNTIIESSEDDEETPGHVTEAVQVPKKGRWAVSVEDDEDIEMIHSSCRPKPKNPNTIIESSDGEDEVTKKPTESAEAELSQSWTLLMLTQLWN